MNYNREERLEFVLDIVYKLKHFRDKLGNIVDLYKDSYSFVPEFKRVCNEYIRQEGAVEKRGFIEFYEMDRIAEYKLPIVKGEKSLFVFRVREP